MGTGEGGTFATREYAGDEREREKEKKRERERERQRGESGTDGAAEGVIRE